MAALKVLHGRFARRIHRLCRARPHPLAVVCGCPSTITVRHASVDAALKAESGSNQSRGYIHAEKELAKMQADVWDSSNRTDGFLRHLAYSPSLAKQDERLKIAVDFFEKAKAYNLQMNVSRFNLLLQVFVQCEHDFDPKEYSGWMHQCSVEPDMVTCNLLIMGFSQRGNLPGAVAVLQMMRKKDFTVGEQVYASLIMAYSRAGELDKSFKMMSLLEANGISPTAVSFRALLFACADAQASEKLEEVMQMASKAGVFIDYTSLRDLLLRLGNHGAATGMAIVLRETRNLVFMRSYMAEVMQILVEQSQTECAVLIYDHLLHLPLEVKPAAATTEGPTEHPADVGFLAAVLASKKEVSAQLAMILEAHRAAPAKSHVFTMYLRHQLDHPGLMKDAEKTFVFMHEHQIPVYPHWLQEVLAKASEEGNVRAAVKLLSMFTATCQSVTPLVVRMVMDAAVAARTPLETFLGYMRCVQLSPAIVNDFVEACASASFTRAGLHGGLSALLAEQAALPKTHWTGQDWQSLYLRQPIDVGRVCKHLAKLSQERTLPEAVAYLESVVETCDLKSCVELVSWTLAERQKVLLSVRKEVFEKLLNQLYASQMSKEFFDLSRAIRDFGIAPPASWKGMALSMHLCADNVDSAALLYDMILDSDEDAKLVAFQVHRQYFAAMFAANSYAAIVKCYERLLVLDMRRLFERRELHACVALSYIRLHQLDAAKDMLFGTNQQRQDDEQQQQEQEQQPKQPKKTQQLEVNVAAFSELVAGYSTEKRYAAAIDAFKRLDSALPLASSRTHLDALQVVLKACVELPDRATLHRVYGILSTGGVRLPKCSLLLAEAFCNAGEPKQAAAVLKQDDVSEGRVLWKIFSAYLQHHESHASWLECCMGLLKSLRMQNCYGHFPSLFMAVLSDNDPFAKGILQAPGFALPINEVTTVFIKPLVLGEQWKVLRGFFKAIAAHPACPRLLEDTLELLVASGHQEAGQSLLLALGDVGVSARAKRLLSTSSPTSSAATASPGSAPGSDAKDGSELGSLDRSLVSLLVEAPL